jgi:nitroimidazol reductase NimA-like FMN-containing flavoprotein (pyridoxamine 5'-phosphate oxidase superfamily)
MNAAEENWDLSGRMTVLDEAGCVERIESTPVGRIGFVSDGKPLVLPVNFAWYEGGVVFRTLEGQKLAAAAEEQEVCFEVDEWDRGATAGWSVVMTGVAHQVTDWAEIEVLERLGLVPWARGEWKALWVRIEPDSLTGRVIT